MLDLDLARPGQTLHRFVFGGVAFEVEAHEAVQWELWPEFERHTCEGDRYPVLARVRCIVRVDPSLPTTGTNGIVVERDRDATDATVVIARGAHCELAADGRGRYTARVRIAPRRDDDSEPQGPDAVVLGLSAAILEREGGLSLHAAAIELEGRAVLFVGPSGAGKSTAAQLARGSRVFAFDRVNVVPDGAGGYAAWSLPGGASLAMAPSAHRRLPLGAILRVRQGRGAPRIERLSATRGIFALRESIWLTDSSPSAEEHRMDAAALLRGRVRVAEIHTVLGQPHTGLISQWMFDRDSLERSLGGCTP
jgi:hypothetical protein